MSGTTFLILLSTQTASGIGIVALALMVRDLLRRVRRLELAPGMWSLRSAVDPDDYDALARQWRQVIHPDDPDLQEDAP